MRKKSYELTEQHIRRYALHLYEQERAAATIKNISTTWPPAGLSGRRAADKGGADRLESRACRHPRPGQRQFHAGRRQRLSCLYELAGADGQALKIQKTLFRDEERN